ncbi:helix-turn-helix domain-containing protein [Streptosporangium sandarakinum]|uniref:helix-turn-helix domain-containing protein n=1 Tax=Streptosporangium sandarakinum TaxID=1260955 RepID=UPI003793A48A
MTRGLGGPLPDGTFATPDPNDPSTVTLWWVVGGKLKPWPLDKRWAPLPPRRPKGLAPAERRAWRDNWYASHYYPWKDAVIAAIAADLPAAAALFDELVPPEERPTPDMLPVRPARQRPSRARTPRAKKPRRDKELREAFTAATLASAGMSVRRIAKALGVTRSTAWRRIEVGRVEHAELLARMDRLKRGGPFVMGGARHDL